MSKIKTTNEAGEEVEIEAFTQEEVDAKMKEQEDTFNAKIAEKDNLLQTTQQAKEELEGKMKDIKPDHPNFAILKEELKKKDEEIKNIKNEIDGDKKSRLQEAMDGKIKSVTNGNEDFEKKVRLHLTSSLKGMPETTEEERTAKISAAVKLSTDVDAGGPGMFDNGINGGGGEFKGGGDGTTVEFSSKEKSLGAKLGITDADYKKYGPRLVNKKK